MNASDEASRSCWMEALPDVDGPPLSGEARFDLTRATGRSSRPTAAC